MGNVEQTLSFVTATDEHLPEMVRNETRSYAFPWTEGVFRDCINGPQDCWLALNDAGNVVGHAILSLAVAEAHLLNVCIARDQQGFGYGRQFMHFILRTLANNGAEVLFLEVRPSNRVAIRLYESMGFREIGVRKDYYPAPLGREDARVLALQFDLQSQSGADPAPVPKRDHRGAV